MQEQGLHMESLSQTRRKFRIIEARFGERSSDGMVDVKKFFSAKEWFGRVEK
jgi:hypothetical protein